MKYILALDQGTSSSRAILFNQSAQVVGICQKELKQYYPKSGWVEQDPMEIIHSQWQVVRDLISETGIDEKEIASMAITNQRETTICWNKKNGKPVHNAIVWQDKRTVNYCRSIASEVNASIIKERTGLLADSYFSASNINWILENVYEAKQLAQKGDLLFGTVDTWLLWNATMGEVHATDISNASRTLLFNIHSLEWDEELLRIFNIPASVLPEVKPTSGCFGIVKDQGLLKHQKSVHSMVGDQQAALFGQRCFDNGMAKNTYGTGCFILMNTGTKPMYSKQGLLTTIAWQTHDEIMYALEGSVFVAGAAVKWLRDSLDIISCADETEDMASAISDDHGVYFVPAMSGLGAPYWDMSACGGVLGISHETDKRVIVRAALEAMAYQTRDVVDAMVKDAKMPLVQLHVDGGASKNNFLMQFQADIMNCSVHRAHNIEATALGAAFFAGLASGFWTKQDLKNLQLPEDNFNSRMDTTKRSFLYSGWKKAVKRVSQWNDD